MLVKLKQDFIGSAAGNVLDVSEADAKTLIERDIAAPAGDNALSPALTKAIETLPARLTQNVQQMTEAGLTCFAEAQEQARRNAVPAIFGDGGEGDPKKNFGDWLRHANKNLRTRLNRIIRRAGLEPWPKLFHNLRASRETELAEFYPMHVVCTWIGNTERIAAKHYLQVTEDYFTLAARQGGKSGAKSGALAAQNPAQQPAAPFCTDSQDSPEGEESSGLVLLGASGYEMVRNDLIPPRGLEPLS